MVVILRFPLAAFGFVVEQLRRLPGARAVDRHAPWVTTGLMLGALVAFVVWGLQRAPQRISLAELAAGQLSPMQSWIIVSGELRSETSRTPDFRYRLTDPAVPGASMVVVSEVELPLGQTTVSGWFVGPRELMPAGFRWRGQMRADPVLAEEPPQPWIAVFLAAAGLLVGIAGRVSYPMFFAEKPRGSPPRAMTLRVGVQRAAATSTAPVVPGTLRLQPGVPVQWLVPGSDAQRLRLSSVFTGVDVGELRRLFGAQPVLRVHQATGELSITFESRDERDAAFAALAADAARGDRAQSG